MIVTFGTPYADWKNLFSPVYPASTNTHPEIFNTGWKNTMLTSAGPFRLKRGGAINAIEGRARLAEFIQQARGRVIIVPGAGITGANVDVVAKETGADEFHAGLSSAIADGELDGQRFEEEVSKLLRLQSTSVGKINIVYSIGPSSVGIGRALCVPDVVDGETISH